MCTVAYHQIRFVSFFFFRFFRQILFGPYLWNRCSQRLQIECAAWSCGLILHCCLPSNLLRYLFFLLFFFANILSGPYLWNRCSQRLQIECAAWSCGLIFHCCLPSNSLCYFFFRHDFATILSRPYLWNGYSQRLQTECEAWSCGLILHCYLPSNSLCYFVLFSRHNFAIILSGPYLWNRYSHRLQIEFAAWSCGLFVHYCLPSNWLRYFFFHFFLLFFAKILSGPYLWNRCSQRLQIECAAWSCGLILHCCLLSNSFCYLFFPAMILPRFCPGHISGTVTRRDSKMSVLLGPAV